MRTCVILPGYPWPTSICLRETWSHLHRGPATTPSDPRERERTPVLVTTEGDWPIPPPGRVASPMLMRPPMLMFSKLPPRELREPSLRAPVPAKCEAVSQRRQEGNQRPTHPWRGGPRGRFREATGPGRGSGLRCPLRLGVARRPESTKAVSKGWALQGARERLKHVVAGRRLLEATDIRVLQGKRESRTA